MCGKYITIFATIPRKPVRFRVCVRLKPLGTLSDGRGCNPPFDVQKYKNMILQINKF